MKSLGLLTERDEERDKECGPRGKYLETQCSVHCPLVQGRELGPTLALAITS